MNALVLPTLDTQPALDRVLSEIPAGFLVVVVDDGSDPALRLPYGVRGIRHPENRGYGAAQKAGYAAALDAGADRVALLHGDGQYATADVLALLDALDEAPAVLGSRFLADPSVIPGWRRLGNRALTGLANWRFGSAHTDLHTGARAFRAELLRAMPLAEFSDDFVFDQQVLAWLLRGGVRVAERPARTRYDEATRSISPWRSVVYGVGCLRAILG
ncbi:MAG: glycosyltransferase family 2 protein [Deltaproteobacteria bacterium]|nr:glycosyltransferase family 2 protein [Deltaproteobacteria bacterium]